MAFETIISAVGLPGPRVNLLSGPPDFNVPLLASSRGGRTRFASWRIEIVTRRAVGWLPYRWCGSHNRWVTMTYEWRSDLEDAAGNVRHAEAFGHRGLGTQRLA